MKNLIKNYFFIISFIQTFIIGVNSFDICVVGASSGLGKELIYQALEKNKKVLGLTSFNKKITYPYRDGGLKEQNVDDLLIHEKLIIDKYKNSRNFKFKNLVFTTGSKPFEQDYSDEITNYILSYLTESTHCNNLENIILISADGVGDSLPKSNAGIKIMNNWYLKDVYRAKNEQEILLNEFGEKNNINITIIRPKVLSYGVNLYAAKSREKLANEILTSLFE